MHEHYNKKEILESLIPVVENTAMRYNLIPLEVSLEKENGRWFLRIFIYSNDHPISHLDCENVTRGLDNFLDELIPFKYYLEVSSPGMDKKLKSPREYTIFKGKDVVLKLKNQIEGLEGKTFKAILVDYLQHDGLVVKLKDYESEITLPLSDIQSVRLDEEINIKQNKGEEDD